MLTVDDVVRMADKFCRYPAVDRHILKRWSPPIGAAHELGHLLLSTASQRTEPHYGLGDPSDDDAWEDHVEAPAVEIAASILHTWILVATPWFRRTRARADLRRSISPRDPLIEMAPEFWPWRSSWRKARALLASKGLTPACVQTADALRANIIRTLETT